MYSSQAPSLVHRHIVILVQIRNRDDHIAAYLIDQEADLEDVID